MRPTRLRVSGDRAVPQSEVVLVGGRTCGTGREGMDCIPVTCTWTGRARDNRSKVWAYGLRNPWRFTVRPGSGAVVVGELGWRRWEGLDVAARGANLGWPCYEGHRPQPAFAHFRICKRLSQVGARRPLFAYPRGRAASVTGGVFVRGPRWPSRLRGAYVFGDCELRRIRVR